MPRSPIPGGCFRGDASGTPVIRSKRSSLEAWKGGSRWGRISRGRRAKPSPDPPALRAEAIDQWSLGPHMAEEKRYGAVIGCTVDRALPEYGMLQLRAGASLIDLVDIGAEEGAWARPESEGGRNMDHVCLSTGPCDVQAMRAHLARHGVAIVEEGIRYGAKGDGIPSTYAISREQTALKGPIA